MIRRLATCLPLALLPLALPALEVRITPPEGARFVVDQRFDVRVTVALAPGEQLSRLSVRLDDASTPLLDVAAVDARGAATFRNASFAAPGRHRIVAMAETTASSGGARVESVRDLEVLAVAGPKKPLKNVIFLLGDGMGAAHRTAARIVRHGYANGHPKARLAMDEMPVTGLVMTASLNSVVTDSSPGMSCYMTGNKSNNDQEGVFPDGDDAGSKSDGTAAFDNPRVEYLAAYLHRHAGKALGVVTTADVEDATPAATAVHTGNRDLGAGICDQFLDERAASGLAVLLGGGRRWFLPADGGKLSARTAGSDYDLDDATERALGLSAPTALDPERDLLGDFAKAGFRPALSKADLDAVGRDLDAGLAVDRLLGLFAYGHMNVAFDKIAKRRAPDAKGVVDDYRAPDQPMLDEMAAIALRVLERNPQGFVLMIEGASIDKQSHAMDADRAIWDTLEFDRTVEVARRYAREHGDTLVVVTADHECSGFSVIGAVDTAALAALGPDADRLAPQDKPGRQQAVDIYDGAGFPTYEIAADGYPKVADPERKLLVSFGAGADRFEGWLAKPLPVADGSVPPAIRADLDAGTGPSGKVYPKNPLAREENRHGFFLRGAQAGSSSAVHTATDIVLSADGGESPEGREAAAQFGGYQENTDVFSKILRALLGGY